MPRSLPGESLGHPLLRRIKAGALCLAAFLVALAVCGFLFAWSGLYSVAASRGHWPWFNLILKFGMSSSVRTHAVGIDVPNLENATLAERGAAHFQGGCAPCHGAPGRSPNPIVRAMLPEPPDLSASVPSWKPNELFWIVKNGLKYTGMPAWAAQERDDEVWAVVAFLQLLPQMDVVQYREMAALKLREQDIPIRALAQGGPVGTALAACSRCHGMDGLGRASGAFPRLDIQSTDYLFAQLEAYAAGTRHSGIMQSATAELDATEMRRLADYYSAQSTMNSSIFAEGQDLSLALGRTLATTGMPDLGIPACFSCHAEDLASRYPLYPSLAGQFADYTSGQLTLFKSGRTNQRRLDLSGRIASADSQRCQAMKVHR